MGDRFDVTEARRLLEEATPGPWRSAWDDPDTEDGEDPYDWPVIYSTAPDVKESDVVAIMWHDGHLIGCEERNAALIAAAPTLIAAACDEVERLSAELGEQDAALFLLNAANDRLQLALDAERGVRGLEGWTWDGTQWTNGSAYVWLLPLRGWHLVFASKLRPRHGEGSYHPTALEAMEAANAALEADDG